MEYLHPLKSHYKKFQLIESNVTIGVDALSQRGAYIGSLRNFLDRSSTTKEKLSLLYESTKPVIITKDTATIKINTRFLAANEAFKVMSIDRITNPGILYMSVEPVPKLHSDNTAQGKAVTPSAATQYKPLQHFVGGQEYTIPIIDGFVNFVPSVKIVRRTINTVTFYAPMDAAKMTITLKDNDNNLQVTEWSVI